MLPGGSTDHGREADYPDNPDLLADRPVYMWPASTHQDTTTNCHQPWQIGFQQYNTLLQQHCWPLTSSTTRASSTTTSPVCNTADTSTLPAHGADKHAPHITVVSQHQSHTDTNHSDIKVDIFNSDAESTAASQEAIIQEENVAVSYPPSVTHNSEVLYDFEIRDYSNIRTNITNILTQVNELEELQKSLRRQIRNQNTTIWEQEHQIHMLTRFQNITIEQQENQISVLSQTCSDLQNQLTDYKTQVAFLQTIISHHKNKNLT